MRRTSGQQKSGSHVPAPPRIPTLYGRLCNFPDWEGHKRIDSMFVDSIFPMSEARWIDGPEAELRFCRAAAFRTHRLSEPDSERLSHFESTQTHNGPRSESRDLSPTQTRQSSNEAQEAPRGL